MKAKKIFLIQPKKDNVSHNNYIKIKFLNYINKNKKVKTKAKIIQNQIKFLRPTTSIKPI